MATKSKKKAQKDRRRRKKQDRKRRSAKLQRSASPTKRLVSRIASQTPVAWQGEIEADVAIFDEASFSRLKGEDKQHAQLIREALDALCQRSGAQSLQALNVIPRRSMFAEWRLFLRGFEQWLQQDVESAQEAWARLDKHRRPARIARSLELSHRDDLSTQKDGSETPLADVDPTILYHAQLVRKFLVERSAIRAARAITKIPTDDGAYVLPEHITWLRSFTTDYQSIEPDLVQALHETAVQRAFCGRYVDLFEDAVKHFRGPRHDRKNSYSRFWYSRGTNLDGASQKHLDRYLSQDVPNNTELTPALRNALTSQVHSLLAAEELMPPDGMNGAFSMFGSQPDMDLVEYHLEQSIKACPKNRISWDGYELIYADALLDGKLNKAERQEAEKRLAEVRQRRIEALPDDVDTRMALVDYYFENDQVDAAAEHVDWLSGMRCDDPLADAMPWRFNLLESMRLCRRKAWLNQVPQHLDKAVEHWPDWLSGTWLPYLRAAVKLRSGDKSAMDTVQPSEKTADTQAIDIVDACMKLSAAQKMRVPGADLKPLREPIEAALKNIDQLSTSQLLELASFFWDLHRTRLQYPAYRMHGTKFLWELLDRFDSKPDLVLNDLDSPLIRDALLIMANEGMFNSAYHVTVPAWMNDKYAEHPVIAAVYATCLIRRRFNWRVETYGHLLEPLRKTSRNRDVFYRHAYSRLATELEERIGEAKMPSSIFDVFGFDGYNEDDDEDDDFQCDCDKCRAARGEI